MLTSLILKSIRYLPHLKNSDLFVSEYYETLNDALKELNNRKIKSKPTGSKEPCPALPAKRRIHPVSFYGASSRASCSTSVGNGGPKKKKPEMSEVCLISAFAR